MNDELERVLVEAALAYFKVIILEVDWRDWRKQ
jgi:hypothetical protein